MRFAFIAILLLTFALAGCRRERGDGPDATESPSPVVMATGGASMPATASVTPALTASPERALPVAEPGLHEDSMSFGGLERTWRVYVPASLPAGQAAPLVIGLHGGTGSGAQFENTTRIDAQAEAGPFIAVYPDGTGVAKTWNGGACCGYAVRNDIDDVAFIAALIDELAIDYPIDLTRVYATGHSNGAILALRLACELSHRVAAVAGVAGSLEVSGCSPSRPVSVLLIHGDADESHPIEGGEGPDSISGVPFNSVANTMETVRVAMGCSADATTSVDGAVTTGNWTGCPAGIAVQLQVIAGASHSWPGGKPTLVGAPPSQALDATAAVWQFMSQYAITP